MNILLYCSDVVGSSMAGPAIRYWEFAKALGKHHHVVLFTPNVPDVLPENFIIKCLPDACVYEEVAKADILISQIVFPRMALKAKRHGVKIILDAYDPMPLENLEVFRQLPLPIRRHKQNQIINHFTFFFKMSDAVISANQEQRSLWIGFLMGLNKLTPDIYDANEQLKHLIDIVPFGLSSTPPQRHGEGLRKMFNLKETDKVLLWGGGIWNWFDPITLIKAVKEVSDEGIPIKLVFMGIKHPNPFIPAMKMASDAVQLAKDLDLLDKVVFFNYGWVPYQQRQSFLLDADIGVSTHSEHLETQFAFRTRMLDYIWAGLPIIATSGDSFAELIEKNELGVVVPYNDVNALAQAIKQLVLQPDLMKKMKENLNALRPQFYWDILVQPIDRLAKMLSSQPKKSISLNNLCQILGFMLQKRSPKHIFNALRNRWYGYINRE